LTDKVLSEFHKQDLHELWRRIVFNILISNVHDHLRNHGFLYETSLGWRLSPAYDLNPVPRDIKARFLSTNISLDDSTASIELAMEVHEHFGLDTQEATRIVSEVKTAVAGWRQEAIRLKIKTSEIDRMASAF